MEDLAPLNWQVTLYTRKKGILHMFTTMLISSIFKSLTQKLDLANFQFQSIHYTVYIVSSAQLLVKRKLYLDDG